MKKVFNNNLLLLPTIIFPYAVVVVIGLYFSSYYISDELFNFVGNNLAYFGIGLLVLFLVSVISNIIYIIRSKNTNTNMVLKASLKVKFFHIPPYVLIFVFGLLCGLMFFMTLPLILFLVFIDIITLILSDIISIYALVKSIREDKLKSNTVPKIAIVCQFFFCADFISILVAYLLRRSK